MEQEQQNPTNSTNALKLTPEGEEAALSVVGDKEFKASNPDTFYPVHHCDKHCTEHNARPESKPEEPKLTKKQIGQLRRQYFTIVHGSVIACGHKAKFGPGKQPTNNCVDCWTAFFATHVDLLAVHKLLADQGVGGLEKKFGTKFMRNFHGFLALYLKEQREAEGTPAEVPAEPEEAVAI